MLFSPIFEENGQYFVVYFCIYILEYSLMISYFLPQFIFSFNNFSLSMATDFLLPISPLLDGMRYHGFIK